MAATNARREDKRYTVHKHFYGDWRAKFPKNLRKTEKSLRSQERRKQGMENFLQENNAINLRRNHGDTLASRRMHDRLKGCEALANLAE